MESGKTDETRLLWEWSALNRNPHVEKQSAARYINGSVMGEWKTALSVRVRRSLKEDLQKIADREYRKLGNLGELLMEWSYEQLTAAGSTAKLLKRKVRSSAQGSKQP